MFVVAMAQSADVIRYLSTCEGEAMEWVAEPERAFRMEREEAEKLVANYGGALLEIE